MARMLGNTEVAFESARSQFWVVDANVSNLIQCSVLLSVCYCLINPSDFKLQYTFLMWGDCFLLQCSILMK